MANKARKKARTSSRKRVAAAATASASALRNDSIRRVILGREIQRQIDRFGLSRRLAAVAVGDAATQLSRLMKGHFSEFSADRLVKMLVRLGSDVTITIRHPNRLGRRGRVRIQSIKVS